MTPLHEAPVWIELNGVRRVLLSCSPHDAEALALGHLLAEGWIQDRSDVIELEEADSAYGATGVRATVRGDAIAAAESVRAHQLHEGCGARHYLECEPFTPRRGELPAADLPPLFRELFGTAERASPEGGIHAVALCAGNELRYLATDVARHSAVDRLVGYALRDGADLRELGLISTARVSATIALKAVRAGVAWVASRSVGTSLARELAGAAGVPLLERAARRSAE